jgi:hypothetical protein
MYVFEDRYNNSQQYDKNTQYRWSCRIVPPYFGLSPQNLPSLIKILSPPNSVYLLYKLAFYCKNLILISSTVIITTFRKSPLFPAWNQSSSCSGTGDAELLWEGREDDRLLFSGSTRIFCNGTIGVYDFSMNAAITTIAKMKT